MIPRRKDIESRYLLRRGSRSPPDRELWRGFPNRPQRKRRNEVPSLGLERETPPNLVSPVHGEPTFGETGKRYLTRNNEQPGR